MEDHTQLILNKINKFWDCKELLHNYKKIKKEVFNFLMFQQVVTQISINFNLNYTKLRQEYNHCKGNFNKSQKHMREKLRCIS